MKPRFALIVFTLLLLLPVVALAQGGDRPAGESGRPVPLEPERLPHRPGDERAPAPAPPATMSDTPLLGSLVYYIYEVDNDRWKLYTYSGGSEQRLIQSSGIELYPDVSRELGAVVYSQSPNASGSFDLFILPNSGTPVRLLELPGNQIHARWSPDGRQIAFQWQDENSSDIYVVNVDGSNLRRVTYHPGYDGMPTWSPDGRFLAFTSNRSGAFRIWRVDVDGSTLQQLGNTPVSVYPAWSPDGGWIAYSADSNLDGWLELWVMDANGGNAHLYHAPGSETTDLIARDWRTGADGGSEITLTSVVYIKYQGEWYWTSAKPRAIPFKPGGGKAPTIVPSTTAWGPAWAIPDRRPPLFSLPQVAPLAPATTLLSWTDDSGIGLPYLYELERRAPDGAWEPWHTQSGPGFALDLPPGQPWEVRVRARDLYANWSDWQYRGPFRLYHWSLAGRVTDNAGVPLTGATVESDPAPFLGGDSDRWGQYRIYVAPAAAGYQATWHKAGYGALPPTTFAGDSPQDTISVALPSADNALAAGNMESELDATWQADGVHRSGDAALTGAAGARLYYDESALALTQEWFGEQVTSTTMTVGSDRTVHLAYAGEQGIVYLSRSPAGTWSDSSPIPGSAPAAASVDLALDRNNGLHLLAFYYTYEPRGKLFYYYRPAGGSWTAQQLDQEQVLYGRNRLLVTDTEVIALYVKRPNDYSTYRLYARRRPLGGSWGTPDWLSVAVHSPSVQSLADAAGTVHTLWESAVSSTTFYLLKPAGGEWLDLMALSKPAGARSTLAVLPQGDVFHLTPGEDLRIAHRNQQGEWSEPSVLVEREVSDIRTAAGADGTLHVTAVIGADANLYLSRSPQGVWSTPVVTPGPVEALVAVGPVAYQFFGSAGVLSFQACLPGQVLPPVRLAEYTGRYDRILSHEGMLHLVGVDQDLPVAAQGEYLAFRPAETQAALSRQVTVPDVAHPRLSFFYRPADSGAGQLEVLAAGESLARFDGEPGGWVHASLDLAHRAGQPVTLTFRSEGQSSTVPFYVDVDDVTLGSSYPDLLVEGGMPWAAPPGAEITLFIRPVNQSPVPSPAEVELVLPAELEWMGATPAPDGRGPYRWDLGTLVAGDEPGIAVNLRVAATATFGEQLVAHVRISGDAELALANNSRQATTTVGHAVYLPAIGATP